MLDIIFHDFPSYAFEIASPSLNLELDEQPESPSDFTHACTRAHTHTTEVISAHKAMSGCL